MQGTDNFKKAIQDHLDGFAIIDPLFAESLKKPNKNIDDCCTYILNQVKKSGKMGFEDGEVFNMAIHYYDEHDIEVGEKITNVQVVVNRDLPAPAKKKVATASAVSTPVTAPVAVAAKAKVKPKTIANPQQFSLF